MTPSQENRRSARRHKPKGRVKVVCYKGTLDLGENIALALLDVSETGIKLLVKKPLAKDDEVLVLLEGQGLRPIKCPGRVAWAVPTEDGNCVVGVRLNRFMSYRDVMGLT